MILSPFYVLKHNLSPHSSTASTLKIKVTNNSSLQSKADFSMVTRRNKRTTDDLLPQTDDSNDKVKDVVSVQKCPTESQQHEEYDVTDL